MNRVRIGGPTGERAALTPKERRQRNRDEMMAAILEAARAVMREEGAAALSLHEVARRVGLKTPSLYVYFPSKAAVYDALFVLGVRLYAERREQIRTRGGTFWERLQANIENYFSFAQEYPELYQIVFERPVPGFVPSDASMEESRRLLGGSDDEIAAAIHDHEISLGIPAGQARDLIIAVMHGITALHVANEPQLPLGSGRFGSLIPAAVALFQRSWSPEQDGQRKRKRSKNA